MVTADEIGRVMVLASLGPADRERLSRAAADISLAAGEYAANPGDEGALFAVLAGRVEAVRIQDGIERVVGVREPGDIFGEVPITLGTFFPVGFRASEPSRVMRVEPPAYHAAVAASPDVAKEVGRLAAVRMSGPHGLQGLAAERNRLGQPWSGAGAIPRARSCAISSTATRSASNGFKPTRRMQPSNGAMHCRPTRTAR
jgi:thioredoxin reductase (NADPH)